MFQTKKILLFHCFMVIVLSLAQLADAAQHQPASPFSGLFAKAREFGREAKEILEESGIGGQVNGLGTALGDGLNYVVKTGESVANRSAAFVGRGLEAAAKMTKEAWEQNRIHSQNEVNRLQEKLDDLAVKKEAILENKRLADQQRTRTQIDLDAELRKEAARRNEYTITQLSKALADLELQQKSSSQAEQEAIAEMAKTKEELAAARAALNHWDDMARNFVDDLRKAPFELANKLLDNDKAVQVAAVQAEKHAKKQAETEMAKFERYRQMFIDPKYIAAGAGWALAGAGTVFGCWYGIDFAVGEMRAALHNPSLAQETSIISPSQKARNWFWGIKPEKVTLVDVVLNDDRQEQVTMLAQSVKNTAKNGGNFSNMLFYGPPGTGKTMLGKAIAYYSGLPFMYFSASSLWQCGLKEGLKKVNELFDSIEYLGEPLVLIIDECEVLWTSRDKNISEETRMILTLFLTRMGTVNSNIMVVGLTNRPQDFDEASLSRFGIRLYIGAPEKPEQKRMLEQYLHKYLFTKNTYKPRPPSLIHWLLGKKQRVVKPPVIDEDALGDDMVEWMLENITGLVGRDIEQLAMALQRHADASSGRQLTREGVQIAFKRYLEQYHSVDSLIDKNAVPIVLTPAPEKKANDATVSFDTIDTDFRFNDIAADFDFESTAAPAA
jgi:hypothetical protein